MKPSFSIGEAINAGFSLVKRRPLAVFVWGLLMVSVIAAIYALMIPMFAALPIGRGEGEEAMAEYMAVSQRLGASINGLQLLMYLVMLVTWTAAARATLNPGKRDPFLFLRLGMDEVRVAAVVIAWFFGWYLGIVVVGLVGFGIGFALWFADHALAVGFGCIYGLALIVVSVWLWLRLSLIAPASVILGDFAFGKGWQITKGQVWKLLGMNLLVWLIYMATFILFYAVIGAILVGAFFAQGLSFPAHVEQLSDLWPLARAMAAPGLAALIPLAFMMGVVRALLVAPSVTAARQLLDGVPAKAEPAPVTTDAPPSNGLEPL